MVLRRCGDCPETETESCDDRELPTLEQVSWWSPRWRNIEEIFAHVFHWIWNACGSLLILQLKPVSIECNGFFHNSKWITDAISSVQKTLATSNLGTWPSFDLPRLLEPGEMTMVQSTPSPWMLRVTPLAPASSDRMEGALRPRRPSSAASKAAMGPCHSPKRRLEPWKFERKGGSTMMHSFFSCIFPMVLKDSIGSYNWFYIFRRSESKPSGWWRTSRGMEWPALKDIFLQSDFRLKGENRGHNHKIIVPIYREIKQYIQM